MTVEPGQVRLKPRRSIFSSYDGRGSSIGITPSLGTGTASFSYAFRNDDTGKGCWTGEIQGNRVTLTIKK